MGEGGLSKDHFRSHGGEEGSRGCPRNDNVQRRHMIKGAGSGYMIHEQTKDR